MKKLGRHGASYSDRQMNKDTSWFDKYFEDRMKTAYPQPQEEKIIKKDVREEKDLSAIANAIAERASAPIQDKMKELRNRAGLDALEDSKIEKEGKNVKSAAFDKSAAPKWVEMYVEDMVRDGGYNDEYSIRADLKDKFGLDGDDIAKIVIAVLKRVADAHVGDDADPPQPQLSEELSQETLRDDQLVEWGFDRNAPNDFVV